MIIGLIHFEKKAKKITKNYLYNTKNGGFIENRKPKYGRNMCNRIFVHDFVFDFCSVGVLLPILMWAAVDLKNFGTGAVLEFRVWSRHSASTYTGMLTHYAAIGGVFEIGNFKRHSLMHQTSHDHQIFSFVTQVRALVDCHVLAPVLWNWGRYCELNFENSQKFVNVWGPITELRGGNSKNGM